MHSVMEKSQIKANKAWRQKNRSRSNYLIKRSTAKSFIRSVGSDDDIIALKDLFDIRMNLISGTVPGNSNTDVVSDSSNN